MNTNAKNILIEAALGIGLILAIGYGLDPSNPVLLGIHPHPFWVIILLTALRYGNPAGTIVASACAALYLAAEHFSGLSLMEVLHLDTGYLLEPLFFVLVGSYIGETIQSHRGRAMHLQQSLDDNRKQLHATEERRDALQQAYRTLEGQIAGQTDTFVALYENARALDKLDTEDLYLALNTVLVNYLEVERATIWKLNGDDTWECVFGSSVSQQLPRLGSIAWAERRVVSAPEMFAADVLPPEEGVVAGPLICERDGTRAVVIIHEIPFASLTRRALKVFELVLDWTASALERQALLRTARERDIYDEELGLTSEAYFRTDVHKEAVMLRRTGEVSALLLMKIPELPRDVRRKVRVFIAAILRTILRLSDTAAHFVDEQTFAIYLPGCDHERAAIVQKKLNDAITSFEIHPFGDDRPLAPDYRILEIHNPDDLNAVFGTPWREDVR